MPQIGVRGAGDFPRGDLLLCISVVVQLWISHALTSLDPSPQCSEIGVVARPL